jgi:hypothetical protein
MARQPGETMRTTLDIDDDVLQAAKERAAVQKKTAGQVLSELAREALCPRRKYKLRNGVPVIHRRPGSPIITSADVKRWMDEDI